MQGEQKMKLVIGTLVVAFALSNTGFAFSDMKYERQAEAVRQLLESKRAEARREKQAEYTKAFNEGYAQAVLELTGMSLEETTQE